MISAPDKELQSIQTTINSRILSSVTMIHPAAVGFRSGHSVVMDKKLAALAAEYELTYTRYADDLTFSGDVFPKERIIPRIKQIIRDEKFGTES